MVSGIDVYRLRRVDYTWLGCAWGMSVDVMPALTMRTGMPMPMPMTMTMRSAPAPATLTGYIKILRHGSRSVGYGSDSVHLLVCVSTEGVMPSNWCAGSMVAVSGWGGCCVDDRLLVAGVRGVMRL